MRVIILNVTSILILCLSGRALWADEWIWAENLAIGSPLPQFNVVNVDYSVIPVKICMVKTDYYFILTVAPNGDLTALDS